MQLLNFCNYRVNVLLVVLNVEKEPRFWERDCVVLDFADGDDLGVRIEDFLL